MSFYSYNNANPSCCPGTITGNALDGLQEKDVYKRQLQLYQSIGQIRKHAENRYNKNDLTCSHARLEF